MNRTPSFSPARIHSSIASISSMGVLALGITLVGCGSAPTPDADHGSDLGLVSLAVAAVPPGVGCLRVSVSNASREVLNDLPTTPGVPVTANLSALPLGSVTVKGSAYAEACSAVTSTSEITWLSDPVTATLIVGSAVPVAL